MRSFSQSLRVATFTSFLFSTPLAADPSNQTIPFKLQESHLIVVDGSIGGLNPLKFLIDTGANYSVVDEGVAQKLRLRRIAQDQRLAAFGQTSPMERVVLSGLRLGPILTSLPCIVLDLSDWDVDVIIGMDLLRRNNFTIDYRSKTIRFGARDHLDSAANFEIDGSRLVVSVQLDGQPLRLCVDTGATTLTVHRSRVKSWKRRIPRGRPIRFDHVAGTSHGMKVRLEEVQIGPSTWRGVNAFVLDTPRRPDSKSDGVLGFAALGLERIYFDFESNTVSWEK